MALAALLQSPKSFSQHLQHFCKRPKSFSRHLQHSCKPQNFFRGTCSIPAKSKKFFAAFAALLQTPKSSSRPLRNFRKHEKGENGVCGTSASIKKFLERLAGLSQAFPKVIFPLVCSIFGHSMGMHKKTGPAMSNRKLCFVYQRKNRHTGGAVRGLHVIYSTISTIGAPT